jgi:hypothetical protein
MTKINKSIGALSFFFLLITTSCSSGFKDPEAKKLEAEKLAIEFIKAVDNRNFDVTFEMYHPSFWDYATKDEVVEIYIKNQTKLGALKELRLDKIKTQKVNIGETVDAILMVFENQYEKNSSKENIWVLDDENGILKISGYNLELSAGSQNTSKLDDQLKID